MKLLVESRGRVHADQVADDHRRILTADVVQNGLEVGLAERGVPASNSLDIKMNAMPCDGLGQHARVHVVRSDDVDPAAEIVGDPAQVVGEVLVGGGSAIKDSRIGFFALKIGRIHQQCAVGVYRRKHRHPARRRVAADDHVDVLRPAQMVDSARARQHLGVIVVDRRTQILTAYSAIVVDLIDRQQGTVENRLFHLSQRTRQREEHADLHSHAPVGGCHQRTSPL